MRSPGTRCASRSSNPNPNPNPNPSPNPNPNPNPNPSPNPNPNQVCRGSRVPEASWHTLLLEDHRLRKAKHPDNNCLTTPERAMAVIGLTAKQTLRRCQALTLSLSLALTLSLTLALTLTLTLRPSAAARRTGAT